MKNLINGRCNLLHLIMMHQTSITTDEQVMLKVKSLLRDGTSSSKYHLFGFWVRKMLKEAEA